ncbi:MAG: SDR family oxidoreductase [Deltaproteobacteria bacterium]|nr:SDR family oxidoreductase [Deltaproteobacteria bacterium]
MIGILIIGCGDIGCRVAKLWQEEGASVSAMARSSRSARRLEPLGILPVGGDLDDPASLRGLPVNGSILYYLAPPPDTGETDTRMRAFLASLPPGNDPSRFVYMSTTGVYADMRGGWVTEETPANPETDRGKRRLDAENSVLSWGRTRNVPVVILRVSGIYGPGRIPVERVRAGAPVLSRDEAPFTNRIHSEDLARICVAAAKRGKGGSVYNVSDGNPGTITQYYNAVADRMGLPRPPVVTMAEARRTMSEAMLSYLSESKRVDSRKMREELGITLRYPDLASGLAEEDVSG